MKTNCFQKHLGGVLIFLLCAAIEIHAQQFALAAAAVDSAALAALAARFNNANRGGTTSSGQYNNNGTVGSAVISVDPVTHNIVIIADKETTEQIRRVIASLDAPDTAGAHQGRLPRSG